MHPITTALLALLWLWVAAPAQASLQLHHWTQPSGARVWLAESPAIPMVDVQIDFDAGSRRDPAAQAGLAAASASMLSRGLRSAGTQAALDENQLAEAWTDLGASLVARSSLDRMSFLLRSLTYRAVEEYVQGKDVTKLASMAKLKCGRLIREVADSCLQYWGGMGFTYDNPISQAYRDGRLVSIGGGADEIMLGII